MPPYHCFLLIVHGSPPRILSLSDPELFFKVMSEEELDSALSEFHRWLELRRGFGALLLPYEWGFTFLNLPPRGTLPAIFYGFRRAREESSFPLPLFGEGRGEWDEREYRMRFQVLKEALASGTIYLANLTQRFWFPFLGKETAIPAPFLPRCSLLLHDERIPLFLYSLSPETFLELNLHDRTLATEPIKGTLLPGQSLTELQENEKEQAEHLMVVDMCRNDLGRLAIPGSIRVTRFMHPLPLGYTTHLYSRVEGQFFPPLSLYALLEATFPPASVTGTPKRQAVQLLGELESSPRGYYCGTLGWFSPHGEAHFTLLIRTFFSLDHETGIYGAGGGVMWESDPGREWQELLLKADPLMHFRKFYEKDSSQVFLSL